MFVRIVYLNPMFADRVDILVVTKYAYVNMAMYSALSTLFLQMACFRFYTVFDKC
jgi:hypothetical protein